MNPSLDRVNRGHLPAAAIPASRSGDLPLGDLEVESVERADASVALREGGGADDGGHVRMLRPTSNERANPRSVYPRGAQGLKVAQKGRLCIHWASCPT